MDRGWLFDLYPIPHGMRLWVLTQEGPPRALWEPYAPTFYVRGARHVLDRVLAAHPWMQRITSLSRVDRCDFWTGQAVPVIEVRVQDPLRYPRIVSALDRWSDGALDLFTCSIPLAQRYCYDRGVFPLAFCA